MVHTIFTILIVMIFVGSKFAATSRSSNQSPPRPRTPNPQPTETEEERMRRFMQAVGLPQGSPPPPNRVRSPATQQGPMVPVNPPPNLPTTPNLPAGRLRRAAPAQSAAPSVRTQKPAIARSVPAIQSAPPVATASQPLDDPNAKSAAPLPAIGQTTSPKAPPVRAAVGLLSRLRDPSEVRQAIILREILGPPKALQQQGA